MIAPRWKKLIRDFEALSGRLSLVVLAMVFGLVCVIALTGANATLTRDIATAYTATNPASGILDVGTVDDALIARLRAMEGVAQAEALTIQHTRTETPDGGVGRGMIFVSDSPLAQDIGLLALEQTGPAEGPTVLLERRALAVADVDIGGTVRFDLPGRGFTDLGVAGTVFDPALAPAEQEQVAYAYMDTATWHALGGGPLEMVEVRVTGDVADQAHVDETLAEIANRLRAEGIDVHLVQVPYAETHPHATQMSAVLALFVVFGIAAFLLSAFLVSVTIDGLMVQQIRQIGVLKSIGARRAQLRAVYLVGVGALGLVALAVSLPLGITAGALLSRVVAELLNFDITTTRPSVALAAFWVATGLLGPLLFALRPLNRALSITVVRALQDQGIERRRSVRAPTLGLLGAGVARLALSGLTRNTARSLLIVSLLAASGAVILSARTVAASYTASVNVAADERLHDADVRLTKPLSRAQAEALSTGLDGFAPFDLARDAEVAAAREDGLTMVRTYPDGGHGAMTLMVLEDASTLDHFTVLDGSMAAGFDGGLVLNQSAHTVLGSPAVGDQVRLSQDGHVFSLPLTAVLRQYMTPATGYASARVLAEATGLDGIDTLRFTASTDDPANALALLDTRAAALGSGVASVVMENLMVKAVSGHVTILIVMLTTLGIMIAAVGFAGLAAAQGISVAERRREFGVLRAIGARRSQIVGSLLMESVSFWALALVAALVLSLPLSMVMSGLIGRMTFGLPLPFNFDLVAVLVWAVVSLVGALLASLPPGLAAARSSVSASLDRQ